MKMMRWIENFGGNIAAAVSALAISAGLIAASFAPGLTSAPGFLA